MNWGISDEFLVFLLINTGLRLEKTMGWNSEGEHTQVSQGK